MNDEVHHLLRQFVPLRTGDRATPGYTVPLAGWVCSRCGTVHPTYVYQCPRCVDEELDAAYLDEIMHEPSE